MGSKGDTVVEAVDPLEVAQTDVRFNRIDQHTPLGSLTYSGPERNVATMDLSPEQQAILDAQQESDLGLLNMALGRQADFQAGLPNLVADLETDPSDYEMRIDPSQFEGMDRDYYEDAVFDRGSRLLNTQFDREEDRLRQSLANRGLTGTTDELGEAANTELGLFGQGKNEAFQALAQDAVQRAGGEMRADLASQLGLQQGVIGAEQAAMQAAMAGELQQANVAEANRARQFNEMAALLGMQQTSAPNLSNFYTPSQADVSGAYALENQANMQNAQMAANAQQGIMSGLFGLGSSAILGSMLS